MGSQPALVSHRGVFFNIKREAPTLTTEADVDDRAIDDYRGAHPSDASKNLSIEYHCVFFFQYRQTSGGPKKNKTGTKKNKFGLKKISLRYFF